MGSKKPSAKDVANIEINGIKGRMLNLPAPKGKKRNILLIYGHHASLERMFGIAENLNSYGSVTIPDLPGFGGMDNFYKIGLSPTIDNFADYLASFIKLKFKNKRFTLISMSYSFLIVTKMLQKYPDIAKQVDLLISSVGFVHHEDFSLPRLQQIVIRLLAEACKYRPMAFIAKHTLFSEFVIENFYKSIGQKHTKMQDAGNPRVRNRRIKAEIILWRINDMQTRMKTMSDAFKANLLDKRVDLPVYHVYVEDDRFFNNQVVEQHMRMIYSDFIGFKTDIIGHMPSIVATRQDAEPFIPDELKKLLR